MNELENKAQPRWMQGRPIDSSKPRWMQGKPVGEAVLAPSSKAGGVPVAPAPLPAATAPAGPAPAQAVASAPVIPSAPVNPLIQSQPQAQEQVQPVPQKVSALKQIAQVPADVTKVLARGVEQAGKIPLQIVEMGADLGSNIYGV